MKKVMLLIGLTVVAPLGSADKEDLEQDILVRFQRRDVADLVNAAHLFYRNEDPSQWEAFGAVIARNRSLSRPVLASLAEDRTATGATCYAELLLRCETDLLRAGLGR